ncbi:MAG: hypothetical protein ABSG34_20420 [Candidatus Sulfotelmatobacter sp.]|jgi:hypothetical protein
MDIWFLSVDPLDYLVPTGNEQLPEILAQVLILFQKEKLGRKIRR